MGATDVVRVVAIVAVRFAVTAREHGWAAIVLLELGTVLSPSSLIADRAALSGHNGTIAIHQLICGYLFVTRT